jgi:hypothetical protein
VKLIECSFALLLAAIVVFALVGKFASSDEKPATPSAAHGDAQRFPEKTGIAFPKIHASPDMDCDAPGVPCTDEESAREVRRMHRQWELAPEWLRAKCADFHTGPSFERCLLSKTVK